MIDIVVIDRLVFDRGLFGEMDGLKLMAVSEVSVMSRDNFVILVIGFRRQKLVLGGSFKVMRSLTMVYGGGVMNFMLMFRCHVLLSSLRFSSLTRR